MFEGRSSRLRFPLLCRDCQRTQDAVDFRSLVRFHIPAGYRRVPQFLRVAPGDEENRFLRWLASNDVSHCPMVIVLVERYSVRQNLELRQWFGLTRIEGCHLVDGHPHRIYVRPFGRTATGLGSKYFRAQAFPRTPTSGKDITILGVGVGCRRRGIQIGSGPRKPNGRETSPSLLGDEDIFLHQIEYYLLLEAVVGIVLL